MARTPYSDAVKMLARRDLSEAQVRQRLARLGHDVDSIASAIDRLIADRTIDDARTAGAIARLEAAFRKRGRLRVRQRLAAAGIAPDVAERAVDDVFAQVDADALLASALERRLAGRSSITDAREFGRLYRHLTGQGFEPDHVLRVLRSRQTSG